MARMKDIKQVLFNAPSVHYKPNHPYHCYTKSLVPPFTPMPISASRIQALENMVIETATSMLGPSALAYSHESPNSDIDLPVYGILTRVLPFSSHCDFWWNKLGRPFASMLQASRYSDIAQCKFLCFLYGTVIEMMPPYAAQSSDSIMTIDGSPVELSWVAPQPDELGDYNSINHHSKPKPRQVRFAIEPMHPTTGRRLKGSVVLNYLTSPRGGLGLVVAAKDSMTWRSKTEEFLFPGSEGDGIPIGSRFFVGFDFVADGTIGLKAYYLPSLGTNTPGLSPQGPITLWSVDYTPIRRLVATLEPALMKPLELLLSYFQSLEDRHKPRIQIISMDCVTSSENRLKIYCRPREGTSWSDAVRSFTLGGRLHTPQIEESIREMETLWNNLFPHANSEIDCDLHVSPTQQQTVDVHDSVSNGIPLNKNQHPVGGLLFYYSLFAGENSVYPKLYLPVSHYCSNDLVIARSVEEYYKSSKRRGKRSIPMSSVSEDWVATEVSQNFNHRSLQEGAGIHTYVTFALKKNGSELTNYFSPEPYLH